MATLQKMLRRLDDRLARIESQLSEPQSPKQEKEWYSIAEVAEILGKATFTVREWARLGRVNAMKRSCGRSRASEWMISHEEINRIRNKGLLPIKV